MNSEQGSKDEGRAQNSAAAASVKAFQRHVTALAGMYYRLDKGISGGRNSASTDATIAMHVKACRELLAAELHDESSPLFAALDANPRLADKWNRLERRYYGLRP